MSRGLHEVEYDCHRTFDNIRFLMVSPAGLSSDDWRSVVVYCSRLAEEASRACQHARQAEALAKLNEIQPNGYLTPTKKRK